MTTTPTTHGPNDDIDRDGIPNVLDGTAAFLTQSSMAWHRNLQSICQAAPFDALQAARRYCLLLVEHRWTAPFPIEDAERVAGVLRRQIAGDSNAWITAAEELARLQGLWPNPMDPVGSFLRSALRGMPDFASIGVFNSRRRSDRTKAVLLMRRMLVDAILAQQLVEPCSS